MIVLGSCSDQFCLIFLRVFIYVLSFIMEGEQRELNEQELISIIRDSYSGNNATDIQKANQVLESLASSHRLAEAALRLMKAPEFEDSFKTSCAVIIKRFSYGYSKEIGDKTIFVQEISFLILNSSINRAAKETLGIALEYVFNHEQNDTYKNSVIKGVVESLGNIPNISQIPGYMVIMTAYLNSLVEMTDQLSFFAKTNPFLILNAEKLIRNLFDQQKKEQSCLDNNIKYLCSQSIPAMRSLFSYMEISLSRILQQQEVHPRQVGVIRQDQLLCQILYLYLTAFGNQHSIISRSYPQLNQVKRIAIQIVFQLYQSCQCPMSIYQAIFITFLTESMECAGLQEEEEHIVCRCMELIENHLLHGFYHQEVTSQKMQVIIFSILMYCASKQADQAMIFENPDKFVEISEEFSECFGSSPIIRVRAACFLKAYANSIDSVTHSIVEIAIILLTSSLEPKESDSPQVKAVRQEFQKHHFINLEAPIRVQASLMILTVLAPIISKREDLHKIVYSLMITNHQKFMEAKEPIVKLRVMRMVGYYPTSLYFTHVKILMQEGRCFVLEGIKAFERIVAQNRIPQLFQFLSEIFSELVQSMEVGDSLFQSLLFNNYQRILKKNKNLYTQTLLKIQQTFLASYLLNNHKSLLCLQYLSSLLKNEKHAGYRKVLMEALSSIQQAMGVVPQEMKTKTLDFYEDYFIQIYDTLARCDPTLHPNVAEFAKMSLRRLDHYGKSSPIFKFYNMLLLRLDSFQSNIQPFYSAFMGKIRIILNTGQNLQLLQEYGFLIGQILVTLYKQLSPDDQSYLLWKVETIEEDYKTDVCLIILHYIYVQPLKFIAVTKQQNLYQGALDLICGLNYKTKHQRKILILAISKLMEVEDKYFKILLLVALKHCKALIQANSLKKKVRQPVDLKLRRLYQCMQEEEEHMVDEGFSQNDSLANMKHPFKNYSQFDQLKVRVWQSMNVVNELSEEEKADLRQVLQTDWVVKNTRRIKAVKKQ